MSSHLRNITLADSQACVLWYLYVTPEGRDHAVVASPGSMESKLKNGRMRSQIQKRSFSAQHRLKKFCVGSGSKMRYGFQSTRVLRSRKPEASTSNNIEQNESAQSGRPEGCPSGLPHHRTCGSAYGGSWQSLTDAAATLSLPR